VADPGPPDVTAIDTQLLVIGAGPYALSTAALARDQGIATTIVGRPMGFWRDNMPAGMLLRSGLQWHLDGAGVHTLEAYLEHRGIAPAAVDPVPIEVFLDYAEWFAERTALGVLDRLVTGLAKPDDRFAAVLDDGRLIRADAVVAAPGIRHYGHLPGWAAELPPESAAHTCDLVRFDDLAGARVLIVGGRQSAYEWAALIREHGAATIDIVHRHEIPRFERVSWSFADVHVERTIDTPGYWRRLTEDEQDAVAGRFWEVGRLTLEHWLVPRLDWAGIRRRPGAEVAAVAPRGDHLEARLTDSTMLAVDRIVFATGYRADLSRVPYLAGVLDRVATTNGFPVLDEAFQTSLGGLYVAGFSATRDFGPFFGFVRGCPAAATLIVRDLLARV
jgi:FAD-dependent urate hydroxylase